MNIVYGLHIQSSIPVQFWRS